MPKLSKKAAARVEDAEIQSFAAIPPDVYVVKLNDVDGSREGPAGPYWSWELEVVDGEYAGRKLWVNTSLSDKADFKMKEVFHAFGYSADSDTDEIIGEQCRVLVSQRVIEQGQRKGQLGNNVDECMPLGDADGDEPADSGNEVF